MSSALIPGNGSTPLAPARGALTSAEQALVRNVRLALEALPAHFTTNLHISGMPLPDLFTLNGSLGATIERETVNVLNRLREIWDPSGLYVGYQFVRYAESFPDVRLERLVDGVPQIVMGIELKGWFILSKEGEPSFRYSVTSGCCAEVDLLCIVPWFLSGTIDGTPKVLSPFVESAHWVADVRNYWWEQIRAPRGSSEIVKPPVENIGPYPTSKKEINDKPRSDNGGNFGRVSRVQAQPGIGLLDDYIKGVLDAELSGVQARFWLEFLLAVSERGSATEKARKLARLRSSGAFNEPIDKLAERILEVIVGEDF